MSVAKLVSWIKFKPKVTTIRIKAEIKEIKPIWWSVHPTKKVIL